MKLTIVLLLFFTFQVSANGYAQRVTIVKQNARLTEIFKSIEQQTGYHFFYDRVLLKNTHPIDIAIRRATLDQALSECLKGQSLTYSVVKNTVVIRPERVVHAQSQMISALIETIETPLPPPIEVRGNVKDENGNPLSNASVTIKGTNRGVTTNTNGDFNITVPNTATVLVISFTGYASQEISVGTRTTFNVNLLRENNSLNEVVVTALGIKREARDLGFSVAVVDHDELTTNRTSTALGGLEGKVSGVNITSFGTGPGGSTRIRIRGNSSFSGDNSPLIVIDGVPMDNSRLGGAGGIHNVDLGDGLSSINPDDIESMTVLKGASAAALYGSRAKDGVIMITTKQRGISRGIGVSYNVNYTTETPLDFTDFQYEYGQGEQGIRPTKPWPTSGVWSFGEKIEPGMTQVLFDSVVAPYAAVKDRIKKFYRIGHNLVNTVNLSNRGDKGGFSLSMSNTKDYAIIERSDYTRRNITLGFTQDISKALTISGNVNYSNEYYKNAPQVGGQDLSTASAVWTMSNTMPWDLLKEKYKDANGNENLYSRFLPRTNPYWSLYEYFGNNYRDRLIGNVTARVAITDDIYLQGRVSQDFYSRDGDYNNPTGALALAKAPPGYVNGSYYRIHNQFRERNYDFILGAKKQLGNINVDAFFGGNQMFRQTKSGIMTANDFVQRGLYTIMNGRIKNASHGLNERAVNSLYGSAQIGYKNYLFVTGTVRNDWFSTLAPENRSILYPSITSSFVFTDIVKSKPKWLSFGKLRLSYAQVGDDNVAAYSNVLYYSVSSNLFAGAAGNVPVGNFASGTIPNANLRPLSVSEIEGGINVRLFNDAVTFDFDLYRKTTKDQIVSAVTSQTSGYSTQLINVGESLSKGFESSIQVTPVHTNSFKWGINANVSYNTSKVIRLGLTEDDKSITIGGVREVVGQKLNQIFVYLQKTDAKGNKVFDKNSGYPERASSMVPIGTTLPTWFGGFTNSFNIKGIILTAFIDFKLGKDYKMIDGSNRNYWRHGLHKGTLPGRDVGYVIGNGVNDDGGVNTTHANVQPFYEAYHGNSIMDNWIANAGFWKLRQVSLGYDFVKFLPKVPFIKGFKLNLVANNVAILKKWTNNMDPENRYSFDDTADGSGWAALPPVRSVGFNLNVKF